MRHGTLGDAAFIYRTWLFGLYYGDSWWSKIDKNVFFAAYHKVLERLIPTTTVAVACLADDPDVIVGYAIYRDNVLDWVYVKKSWRKLGIARSLLPQNIDTCTHLNKVGEALKPPTWTFNPFLL